MSSVEPSIQEGIPTTQVASSQPFLSGLNTAPAGGGSSSAAPANINRAQYASLFPNDIISGMIKPMREGGGVGVESGFDMGLEGDLAAQQEVQGGLDPYGDTGSDYSTDVQKALYNPQGFQKGRKTDYMKKMLSLGLANKIQKDKSGKITGIFSSKAPSYMEQFQMDPLGTALKAVVPGAGIVDLVAGFVNPNRQVYTGYNPKITRTTDDMGDDNNQEVPSGVTTLVNNPIDQYRRSIDIYDMNPNKYKLFG